MLNFAPNQVASTAAPVADITSDILTLKLSGLIGPDEPINVASVRRVISRGGFRHIHMVISSTGGDVREANEIYGALRNQPVPVSAVARGCCYSAAIIILMAASLRLASHDAEFLIHQVHRRREVLPDIVTASELQTAADDLRALDEKNAQLLADRTGNRIDLFRDEIKTESTLSVAEAIKIGLVHGLEDDQLNPSWPEMARVPVSGIYCPPRVITENYFDACRCVGSLLRKRGAEA
jgi:ATP-dependent protease ClpP protease subunit